MAIRVGRQLALMDRQPLRHVGSVVLYPVRYRGLS